MDGHGGAPSEQTLELLHNHRVTLDADGIADLQAGRIDPRVVSLLNALSREHTIAVSAMCSDHPKLTTGGSISNHFYGRALDIATVDGKPVGPDNDAANAIARELATLDPAIRPSEIGSPWALSGPAYFTDGSHQNHLHIAYDDPIASDWHAPASDDPGHLAEQSDQAEPDDSGDQSAVEIDDDGSDTDDDEEESGDPDAREDGGSGDTEAEADDESDGDEEEDGDDADDDDDDDDDDDEDEDEDEDEDDDEGPDFDDGADEPDGEGGQGAGDSAGDDGSDADSDDGSEPGDDSAFEPLPDGATAPAGYPGDDAPPARVAEWMGEAARKRGLPPELPVMAALVESGLNNLDGGDADSVGFFQMRLGIWNQGDYAGYPERPELQLDWFLDHAQAVRQQRLAAGLSVGDPKQYGEWIADVERPAEQYRGRYQLRLDDARNLLADLGGSRAASPGRDGSDVVKLKLISRDDAAAAKSVGSG